MSQSNQVHSEVVQVAQESKGEQVISTPGVKTVIKSGEAHQVFAVLRRNIDTGLTDFIKLDHAGITQDGERVINLDDIPSKERGERKPKKERGERKPRKEREPRSKSDRREKSEKYKTIHSVEKKERKPKKFDVSAQQEKKQTRDGTKSEEKAVRKLEREIRREIKREQKAKLEKII